MFKPQGAPHHPRVAFRPWDVKISLNMQLGGMQWSDQALGYQNVTEHAQLGGMQWSDQVLTSLSATRPSCL